MNKKEPFYNYRRFLNERYGKTLYRIPINLGFSCPNRNSDGSGGCTFCGEEGAMAVHLNSDDDLDAQVQSGLDYTYKRYGKDVKLMAYFQAYTSTNAPIEDIKRTFEYVLALAPFSAVTVSTRPDCLPLEVMEYFAQLAKRYDFWVELGIQTANDATLERINRGHNFSTSKYAVEQLAMIGVNVAAHVILGLPGEVREDFINTAKQLALLPLAGIKVHNLHIVKNTKLAGEYALDPNNFNVWDEHEYCEELILFLRHIPEHLPIMRLTSDTPNSILMAPIWWMKKGQFLDYLYRQMKNRLVFQGDLCKKDEQLAPTQVKYHSVETNDGSSTFYSDFFKESFHSSAGAMSEATEKFILPSSLEKRLAEDDVFLLDVGFGLGCNALSAFFVALANGASINITTMEFDREVVRQASKLYPQWQHIYHALLEKGYYSEEKCKISIIWGDARTTIRKLCNENASFDVIFHDAFSTQKNTELWTLSFFRSESKLLNSNGVIVTYSNAYPIRAALLRCNLYLAETLPFGRARGGTAAFKCKTNINLNLLSDDEIREIMDTTNQIAYHDPSGRWSRKKILSHRERVVKKFISLGVLRKIRK